VIWNLIGLAAAGSFFYVGLSILSDPLCKSVSFQGGGARTIATTCMPDGSGDFSRGAAVSLLFIGGTVLFALMFRNYLIRIYRQIRFQYSLQQVSKKLDINSDVAQQEELITLDAEQTTPLNTSTAHFENKKFLISGIETILKWVKKHKLAALISSIVIILGINILSQNYNSSVLIKEIKKNESLMNIFNAANSHNLPKKDPEFNNEFKYGSAVGTLAWDNWFRENIIQVATAAASGIQEENYKIERLKLLPFDSENNEARRTYLIHSHFWVDFLTEVRKCSDIQCYLKVDKDTGESIRSSFRIARIAANDSIPFLDLVNARAEINKIYAS
jgi:hypothetical protein